jgi:Zn-dependent peptidase ImmA (M78 family)
MRVDVKPELLRWARKRSRIEPDTLAERFPKLGSWERRDSLPTLKQLEDFARATHTPVGFLFLSEPPVEHVPIPDFRTAGGNRLERPSPDLLDTIYLCQQRQDWYRDFARIAGEEPRPFVGSVERGADVVETASTMRAELGFSIAARRDAPTWTDALRKFIELAERIGVLVMVNGVVGNNNHRRLDPREFRGFALADTMAPLVFINGADTKAAQMFTLAHELVHVWTGESALTDSDESAPGNLHTERWCNEVAAELLVPLGDFAGEQRPVADLRRELDRLARVFKVSTLVILLRMRDAGTLKGDAYRAAYVREAARIESLARKSGKGNFYLTQAVRNSRRFSRALIADTLEGNTLYRDAFRMLGVSRESTFRQMGAQLGYVI